MTHDSDNNNQSGQLEASPTQDGECGIDIADDEGDVAGLSNLSKAINTSYIHMKRTNPLNFADSGKRP